MLFKIIQDIPGRLRLRTGARLIEAPEARGIERALMGIGGVVHAEVHEANGSILVVFEPAGPARGEVLAAVSGLDALALPTAEPTIAQDLACADNAFALEASKRVAWRLLRRVLVPQPLRQARTILRAVRYIALGLRELVLHGFVVETLDAAAIGAALARGSFSEASSIMFLLGLSELLQEHVQRRSKLALSSGIITRAETVWRVVDGHDVPISIAEVEEGMILHMPQGSVLPVDGTVTDGEGEINEASMTGEAALVHKELGSSVYAGTALEAGDLQVKVTARPGRSRIDAIVEMVEQSSELKSSAQSRAERMADALVPYSFGIFAALLAITRNPTTAMAVLMVDFSCAIKLATPLAVMSAMQEGVRRDIVVKGGRYLEAFAAADAIVFDKTGTLTEAAPHVERVFTFGKYPPDEVLRYAACIEEHFPHSMARAICAAAADRGLSHGEELHAQVEYVVAHGIITTVKNDRAIIGSKHFVFDDEGVAMPEGVEELIADVAPTASVIYLVVNGKLQGAIAVSDPLRGNVVHTLARLRELGISEMVMLTGDSERAAAATAAACGIDAFHAQVLPEDKSAYVQRLRDDGRTVIMVGDGINDSPALAAANVSVALADASDIARAVADISVRTSDLAALATMRVLSQRLEERIHRNYRFIVAFNALLIALGISGAITLTTAAYLHNISTFAIAAASTRPLLPADTLQPPVVGTP